MLLGVTANNHDASLALVDNNNNIVWAAHAERYSRIKNDSLLNRKMVEDLLKYGMPERAVWFENPYTKALRKLYSGQTPIWQNPKQQLETIGLGHLPIDYVGHHESHAAAGFFTSEFEDAAILVVDAIGEWDTVSIWQAKNNQLKCIWQKYYPHSIGLFYSAMTQWAGLKPNEEEYILMGMSAYGTIRYKDLLLETFFSEWDPPYFKLKNNLHRGCLNWAKTENYNKFDIAASAQAIVEEYMKSTVKWMKQKISSDNLIIMGGVALNCVANTKVAANNLYKNIWIMPNPGDAGSAIGSIAALTQTKLNWETPYLGTDINRSLDIESIIKDLLNGKVVAVANGRAEFGPRALGNRSLLCDPRGNNAKSRMNTIKNREQFRPFAPAILSEYTNSYFDMPVKSSPYMQFVANCRIPDELPGICHVDNTSRVQTVHNNNGSHLRTILQEWNRVTNCPVLMNTSLNIKGEPLVNNWLDAERFRQAHNIPIY